MYTCVVVKDRVLWIDGVHMHRGDEPPEKTANRMANLLHLSHGAVVLDTCTGLGYAALALSEKAAKVTTVEKSKQVLDLVALHNPTVFEKKNIEVIHNDVCEMITQLPDKSFDAVLHDPPRFSMAGELYSGVFYKELHRVLKNNGKLFHYTGKPGANSGKNLLKGIKQRLQDAGFKKIEWQEEALGFSCIA